MERTTGRVRAIAAVCLCVLAAGLLVACGKSGGGFASDSGANTKTERVETTRVEVIERLARDKGGFDPTEIYRRAAPGVVTVTSVFGKDEEEPDGRGQGSGFVLSGSGEILTNAHVVTTGEEDDIERAKEVFVEFADFNKVPAEIVGIDANSDIALLKLDPAGLRLRPLPLGTSRDLKVGAPVVAIGSPFGERQSLSIGVISGLDRTIDSLTGFSISGAIQTDAAINRGNSGGPLLGAEGEVVGINSQIRTTGGGSEGVGFAVPVDVVRRSLAELRDDGEVDYGFLGVATTRVYPQLAEEFDLPVNTGALVQEVTGGSPAARAGLRAGNERERFQAQEYVVGGDIITHVGNRPVGDESDLARLVSLRRPGERVQVEYYRDGQRRTVDVELAKRPS
jgi:S1-C subfamily serine protease